MIVVLASGSGRCATQTMGTQFGNIKGVLNFHEGRSLWQTVHKRYGIAPNLSCGNPDARDYNLAALRKRRNKFMGNPGQFAYVESAHYFALNLDLVELVFPEARIIHLYRDPVEVVTSYLFHAGGHIYGDRGKHPRAAHGWDNWGDCYRLDDHIKSRAEGFAQYWQDTNVALSKTALPRLLVQTNELQSAKTWAMVLEFTGIEGEIPSPKSKFNARSPKHKTQPTHETLRACEQICTWRP